MNCPNCHSAMTRGAFDRLYGRSVVLDTCHACHLMWFDDQELLQLAPRATLDLLAAIAREQDAPRTALATTLSCPRCGKPLEETHDMLRATRFTYLRCPSGHGRLLTYFQFLKAKSFVRTLNADEVKELRRRIRQVNCGNCGAPIDLDRGICDFCRTPLAMLDPDQMQKAVAQLKETAEAKSRVDPMLPLALAKERAEAEALFAKADPPDLLAEGLRALRALLS
jgi:endogenous inhibitor of DNA gyrase (YacG/DUF329 family)